MRLFIHDHSARKQRANAFRFDGVQECRCFRTLSEGACLRERVLHCRPADEIDPVAALLLQELATEIGAPDLY